MAPMLDTILISLAGCFLLSGGQPILAQAKPWLKLLLKI
jgi:hypothetical protein